MGVESSPESYKGMPTEALAEKYWMLRRSIDVSKQGRRKGQETSPELSEMHSIGKEMVDRMRTGDKEAKQFHDKAGELMAVADEAYEWMEKQEKHETPNQGQKS